MRTLEQIKMEISLNPRLDSMTADEKMEWVYYQLYADAVYDVRDAYNNAYDAGYDSAEGVCDGWE